MKKSIAFLGATGAVGLEALKVLLVQSDIEKISLFGRTNVSLKNDKITFHEIDVNLEEMYLEKLKECDTAICTLGVGQPSKVSEQQFIRIDKNAVLSFAKQCKEQGVEHFELLASVGINSGSKSLYLRTKGELVEELIKLNFKRLSIFEPSMILTPNSRYGFAKGILYAIWPKLNFLFQGKSKKYRGVKVEQLGKAMALNTLKESKEAYEVLTWSEFQTF